MLGFLKKILGLLVLVAAAYAGFRWGPVVFPTLERALGVGPGASAPAAGPEPAPGPSAELADATLDRFERFRAGDGEARLALGGAELSSVVRYALPGIVPPGVDGPAVALEGGRVKVSARVALGAFPRLPRLDEVLGLLPDTVLLEMEGALTPLDQSFMALLVDRVQVSRIPIPRRMVADVLAGLGREGPASLPEDALAVPIPDGVQAVYVQRDSLVLVAKR